jgi:hypothetical protein
VYLILVVGTFIIITVLSVLYFSTHDGKKSKGVCVQLILFCSLSPACGIDSCTQVPLQHKKACFVSHVPGLLGLYNFKPLLLLKKVFCTMLADLGNMLARGTLSKILLT